MGKSDACEVSHEHLISSLMKLSLVTLIGARVNCYVQNSI